MLLILFINVDVDDDIGGDVEFDNDVGVDVHVDVCIRYKRLSLRMNIAYSLGTLSFFNASRDNFYFKFYRKNIIKNVLKS